ncbi:MAG: hypothetical protein ACRD3V_12570, partial [Vicinamibacteria bacterium]
VQGSRRRMAYRARAAVAAAAGVAGEGTMSEISDWIRKHKCTYEIQPILEMDEAGPTHLGYELNLHAELPIGETLTPEVGKTLDDIRDRLGEVMKSLIPKDAKARIEHAPFRRAVRFPKGAGKNPMVTRTVRVVHPDNEPMKPGDREKFHPTESRLEEMGFTRA